jgi:cytochrome c
LHPTAPAAGTRRRIAANVRAVSRIAAFLLALSAVELGAAGVNRTPVVTVHVDSNRSFLWDDTPLGYLVVASDTEDGDTLAHTIDPEAVGVTFDFAAVGSPAPAPQAVSPALLKSVLPGKALIAGSDCIICHTATGERNIPTYDKIAAFYEDDDGGLERLATKIMRGGGGIWGDTPMPPHPGVSHDQARAMVRYILALSDMSARRDWLPTRGRIVVDHDASGLARDAFGLRSRGRYVLSATYTDRGAPGVAPHTGRATLVLRPPVLLATERDFERGIAASTVADGGVLAVAKRRRAHVGFARIDMTGIRQISFVVGDSADRWAGGAIEVRLDSPVGRPIARVEVISDSPQPRLRTVATTIPPTRGFHTMYLLFRGGAGSLEGSVALAAVVFGR